MLEDLNFDVAINTSKINLQNKKCNYKVLAILSLLSNRKSDKVNSFAENYRYIYENKIIDNKLIIEELSSMKLNTFISNAMKLANNSNLVSCKIQNNKVCYFLHHETFKTHREYITIDSQRLIELIKIADSNAIKIYMLLSYMCKDFKLVTNEYICEQIGLSKKSNRNIQSVINSINVLVENNYILKDKQKSFVVVENKNSDLIKKYVERNKYKIV